MTEIEYTWTIIEVRKEAPNVQTFVLTMDETRPDFIAGQYLTVKLPGHNPVEGKSYSISSSPYEQHLTLTVKQMGLYSSELLSKKVGDTLITSAPYGFFYPEPDDTDNLIFLSGGIGITPCISIIKQLCHDGDIRPLHLFYSNQTENDAVFHTQLTALAARHQNVTYNSYITRQTSVNEPHLRGRMEASAVLSALPNPQTATFFLCGSMYFTRDLWKDLRSAGIAAEHIYTEGFF